MAYQDFKNEWNGRRVDYDHVYGYQCVDLILQYVKECYGIASGVWGNAIDYWYKTSQPLFGHFDRIQTNDCKQGDIVVLGPGVGSAYGHIGICDTATATNVTILQQNGTGRGDPINLGTWNKSLVLGVLRPKTVAPSPGGGTAKVLRQCNVRTAPSTSAPLGGSMVLYPGDTFAYSEKVVGQSVGGNNIWYHSVKGNYVWSGNVTG